MKLKPILQSLLAAAYVLLPCPGRASPLDADDLTLQSMCQNGLTESAILYATAQQQRLRDSDDPFARWTQRLIECEAQAALRAEKGAETHWKHCREIADQFKTEPAAGRRLPWIEWQMIRCDLLLAQDNLARWLAAPANGPLRESALELVRKVLSDSSALEDDLKLRQPLAAKLAADDRSQAPPEQISQLRLDIVLMRCEAYLIRSRLYASGSRDRVGAATNVDAEAGGILDRTSTEWPTRASLEVARATAWLELDRVEEAIALLQSVVMDANNQAARVRAAVAASEALLAQGQPSQARAFVGLLRNLEGGPEWELAEIRLTLSELASLPPAKKDAEIANLLARAKQVGTRYGDYWRARADSILTSSVSSADVSSSNAGDLVVVEVRQLLAAGDETAAVEKLVAASRNELASGRVETAVRFATQAAALLQRQQAWIAAADALEEVTKNAPACEGAAEGHLSAAWNLSQALKPDPQNPQLRERYRSVLQDQIRLWPDSATSEQAAKWLQGWLTASGNQAELLPVFRLQAEQAIAPEKAHEAISSWLGILLSSPTSRKAEIATLQKALQDGSFKALEPTVRVALLAGKAIPEWSDPKSAKRLQAEARALNSLVNLPIDRQLLATVFLLDAARSGDAAETLGIASAWSSSALKPEMVEPIATAVIDAADTWPPNERLAWTGKLALTDEQLQSLSQSSRFTSQAIAWRWRGLRQERLNEAIAGLRALSKQNAKLGILQLHLAHLLAQQQDATALRESTEIAKKLAANSPKSSDLYYAARWLAIRNQRLDGNRVEAVKAAKLILATLSDDAESWRAKFTKLVSP